MKERAILFTIIFTILIDLIGVGIVIPIIPLLIGDPTSPLYLLPPHVSYGQGLILLGYLTASYSIAQFFAASILGQLSDKYGRKPVLLVSLIGGIFSNLVFAYAVYIKNVELMFISRIIGGITGASIAVAQAAIADITTPQNRTKNFGLIGAAFGIGFIIGPLIGGKLSDTSIHPLFTVVTPFIFSAFVGVLNVLGVWLLFPETHKTRNHTLRIDLNRSFHNVYKALTMPKLLPLFITNFLFQGGFTFYTTFVSIYLATKYRFNQGHLGEFFAYIGLWIVFTQGVITRILANKFKEAHVLRVSLFISAFGVLLQSIPPSNMSWLLYVFVPIIAIGNGLTQANLTGLLSKTASPSEQGEILGIGSSVAALAYSIPPILSGYIAADVSITAPLWVSSFIMAFAGIIFLATRPKKAV